MIQLTQKQIARHEVSHALVAADLGKRFSRISIIPSDDSAGHVRYPKQEVRLERELPIALAGFLGQQMAEQSGRDPLVVRYPLEAEICQAYDVAVEMAGGDTEAAMHQLNLGVLQALAVLDRTWDAFGPLVTALLGSRELSWEEAKTVIGNLESSPKLDMSELAAVLTDSGDGFVVAVVPRDLLNGETSSEAVISYL